MKRIGIILGLVALAVPVSAGELLFTNGSRLEADLAGESVLVSTGADLVEVNPETIGVVTPGEIRLKDGRVLHGTLVGGRLRTRTTLGELSIRVEELQSFRARGFVDVVAPTPAPVAPAPPAAIAVPAPREVAPAAAEPAPSAPSPTSATASQPAPAGPAPDSGATPLRIATTTGPTAVLAHPVPGPTLEVVSDERLLRDALTNASTIGRIVRGQTVTKVDAIDRRLHIFNRLIFDGGHWIKVRVGDGTEGWVPATSVREVP